MQSLHARRIDIHYASTVMSRQRSMKQTTKPMKQMKTTHTPGPWKVEADPEFSDQQPVHPLHQSRFVTSGPYSINDDDRSAFVCHPGCQIIAKMTDCQNQSANAHLIAAAPELYDACYQLVGLHKLALNGIHPHIVLDTMLKIAKQAEEALAKAQA